MKTTIDIEDNLLLAAKAAAVQRRTTLRAIVEHALRRELKPAVYASSSEKCFTVDEDGIPKLARRSGVKVTSADIRKIMDEEGI